MGHKGAVQAPGRTEGNGDIQAEAVRGIPGEDGMFLLLGGKGQIQLLLGHQIVLPQFPGDLLPAESLIQPALHQLHRTDAGEHAPLGGDAGDLPCRLEEA